MAQKGNIGVTTENIFLSSRNSYIQITTSSSARWFQTP